MSAYETRGAGTPIRLDSDMPLDISESIPLHRINPLSRPCKMKIMRHLLYLKYFRSIRSPQSIFRGSLTWRNFFVFSSVEGGDPDPRSVKFTGLGVSGQHTDDIFGYAHYYHRRLRIFGLHF